MLSHRLIKLIETHAESLTREVVQDVQTNQHTRSHARIPKEELSSRVLALYRNLGNWIGDPKDDAICHEYEEWGRNRCQEGIPTSEIVFCLILIKKHLRQYIREHGAIIFSGEPLISGEMLPLELYSIQELNYVVGDFFDRALYYLLRGFEAQAKTQKRAAGAGKTN
jgi:hypothetical protein